MSDNKSKSILLLRHGNYNTDTGNLNFFGFMQAMIIAKCLRRYGWPLPPAFITSHRMRSIQMAKIISASLTRKDLPIIQNKALEHDAMYGIKNTMIESGLRTSSFIIAVSHEPAIEGSFRRLCGYRGTVDIAQAFLLTAPTWEDMFVKNGFSVTQFASPSDITFYDMPGARELEFAFKEYAPGRDINKIPALLEYLRKDQKLKTQMLDILNSLRHV